MVWTVLKSAVDQWFSHRSARLGAALAYYSVFSMGPLLLIVIAVELLLKILPTPAVLMFTRAVPPPDVPVTV